MKKNKFILWFDEIGIEDVPVVGGKNASLGEMYQNLKKDRVSVPYGFAITAHAYDYIMEKSGAKREIRKALKGLNTKNVRNLMQRGKAVRNIIMNIRVPDEVEQEIEHAYARLEKFYKVKHVDVAVRSSATAEDLPDASFAGQQETYLNIHGKRALLESCKKCWASLFTNRAISYREDKGFDHFKVALSIGVQKMVRSDLSVSGVMFSIDTETGFRDAVFVTSIYGLGENIVQGRVNPDEYYVFKPTLRAGYKSIISKTVGDKEEKMIYTHDSLHPVKNVKVPQSQREQFALTDKEVLQLAKWAVKIEEHYTKKRGKYTPMDMEWAKDGQTGKLFIVQARPETVQSQKDMTKIEEYKLTGKGKLIVQGMSVGQKIGVGKARVIKDVKEIHKFKPGEVLVTEMTDPDWEPIMKIASAIVADHGGRTCHAAIISRELGIPCIVGTKTCTKSIKTGQNITVDCASGSVGSIYEGKLRYKINKYDVGKIPKLRTKVMLNLGNPEQAFELSKLPVEGIGLAREEFIINSYIGIHPNALLDYDRLRDKELRSEIAKRTAGYKDKAQFFVDKLAFGIGILAAAFYPNDVILRFSDFKTNEYANLLGGYLYEPKEDNPMIGWRGSSRYYSSDFKAAFGLECEAIKKVRDEMGLKNLKVMIPFCRTVQEGKNVLKEMNKHGLRRGKGGLQVYVMCEIPANVILAEEFLTHFDGFSIGSNDLTQLTLGLDRDSELVSHIYDERNDAVKALISQAIRVARAKHKKIGICGDAPSTFPDFAKFLVEEGIDSISLTPDVVMKTILLVNDVEKGMKRKRR